MIWACSFVTDWIECGLSVLKSAAWQACRMRSPSATTSAEKAGWLLSPDAATEFATVGFGSSLRTSVLRARIMNIRRQRAWAL